MNNMLYRNSNKKTKKTGTNGVAMPLTTEAAALYARLGGAYEQILVCKNTVILSFAIFPCSKLQFTMKD